MMSRRMLDQISNRTESTSNANPLYYSDLDQMQTSKVSVNAPPTLPPPAPVPPTQLTASNKGKVEISVVEFLNLMQAQRETHAAPPQYYFISKASYVGIARENFINLKCVFEVVILVKRWLQIKLLPDTVALSSHTIKLNEGASTSERPRIGVMDGGYHLIASQEGELVVELDVLVPYSSVRRSGMSIWVPRAAENNISFTVNTRDIEIKVDPSFVGDSTSPLLKEKDAKEETTVNILFPPTNSLSVNWTVKIDEGPSETKDAPKQQKMMVIAEHNSLCSIGEGVVLLTSVFNYTISHGAVSTFEIAIPPSLHVIGVEGNGIKKWEVIGGKDKMALIQIDTEVKHTYRCLRVVLDYGLEDSYSMTVLSELAMSGTSADVVIPSFKCLGEEINREKGFLAIEARTNVEIAEIKRDYLQMVDTSELPSNVSQLAGNAILLAYKFLSSGYLLELRVKKHDDVGVLIAACDEAHFIVTMSEEGKLLHKLVMRIRNSQKQYVRVRIPTAHELWSASVAGNPVKPAMDDDGMVMVQLQKTSAKDSSANNVFVVEIVYIEREDKPMEKSGNLEISFAQLDIPINYLFVSIHLPSNYNYSAFEGNLKEVDYFSKNPPSGQDYDAGYMPQPQSQSQSNYSRRSSISMDMPSGRREQRVQNSRTNKGVLPVKIDMPVSGTEFKFEQLIVMGSTLLVSTDYTKKRNEYSHNRSKRWCC